MLQKNTLTPWFHPGSEKEIEMKFSGNKIRSLRLDPSGIVMIYSLGSLTFSGHVKHRNGSVFERARKILLYLERKKKRFEGVF